MKLLIVLLSVSVLPAQLTYVCNPSSRSITKLYLGNRLAGQVTRWTCMIHNGGETLRPLAEPTLLMALAGQGVPIMPTADVRTEFAEARRLGKWYTMARIVGYGATAAAALTGADFIRLSDDTAKGLALFGLMAPQVSGILRHRPPSGENFERTVWDGEIALKPGDTIFRVIYSERQLGEAIVKGAIDTGSEL